VEVEHREDEERGDGGGCDAANDVPDVLRRDVAPPAVVEPEEHEDGQRDPEHERDHVPLEVAVVVDRPPRPLEAEVPGERPGGDDERRVDRDLPEPVPIDG
jgi:hypothetical protein